MQEIFFKSASHKTRFLEAMRRIGKIYEDGKFDPEYSAALYILTADNSTWIKSRDHVDHDGIDIEILDEDFSGGHSVLIKLAGNLFNNSLHVDPLEFLRLDGGNFNVAMTAIVLRRKGYSMEEAGQ